MTVMLPRIVRTVVGMVILIALVKGSPSVAAFVPGLLLIGLGVGVMLTPSVNVVQSSFPEEQQGEISGLSRSVSNLGSSFGTAIAGTILVAAATRGNGAYAWAMASVAVFGLIGLWAALLLPALSQARETARRVNCASHLRTLAIATQMYSQDFEEKFPNLWDGSVGGGNNSGPGGWMYFANFGGPARFDPMRGTLFPYAANPGVFGCPSDRAVPVSGLSYALNAALSKATATAGFHEGLPSSELRNPAATALYLEESAKESFSGDSTNDSYFDPRNDRATLRHKGGANTSFGDGHASYLKTGVLAFPKPDGDPRFEP